jgi:glycosyltransferase involved in cell wall biosynthesis
MMLLQVCEQLWSEGLQFELHLVGRVNPHFGVPIVAGIKSLRRRARALYHHSRASDEMLTRLYARARATLFPTIAEGCGLPLLESLWQGVPCVCSDLSVLRENADDGGCMPVPVGNPAAWTHALRAILTDDLLHARLTRETAGRLLPKWVDSATVLRSGLK